MNPHSRHPTSLSALASSLWLNRQLVYQMTKREVIGRYRGSILGIVWSFFNPLVMLAVYTFVFSVVFKARWREGAESVTEFAMVLFAGLIVFNLFSECIHRAPSLILASPNYVKKVVFPLEIKAWVALGASLFHAAVSVLVLLLFYLVVNQSLQWTVVFLPVVLLPLLLLTLGLTWILSSLGVYLRDVAQTVGLITTVLMFLTPIFYPTSALPEKLQALVKLTPLAYAVEQTRMVVIWGKMPDWAGLGLGLLASIAVAWIGFVWFQKTRKGFADVL